MKIQFLDCDGKKKLFSFFGHDYKTWEDPDTGKFYMIDGGQEYYVRYSGGEVKEDTLENLIADIREVFTWTSLFDKDMKRLKEPRRRFLKELNTEHIKNIIKGEGIKEHTLIGAILKEELSYRTKNNIL